MQTSAAADDFRVVCLGGSAGGLHAYMDILRSLPATTGMAFVIAPHRALENAHLLPQLLSTVTKMPVLEVQQGMRLEPNRVFVMPPPLADFEDRALAVGPTKIRCPVEVPIGGLDEPRIGVSAVRAVCLGAETVQRGQRATRGDFEDGAGA